MNTVPVTIEKKAHTIHVKLDAARFERVASALGMFSDEFLKSVSRAEKDIKAGRIHKATSLSDFL
jgi:hypothetical protein